MPGFVRARINDALKNDATKVLDGIGLTVSDVIRMLLTRIAKEQALPIELVVPNARTIAAMEQARAMSDARFETAQKLLDELKVS